MSVYDELNDCIESAWSSDSCEYEVYSEMFDLIADAEYKYDNLKAENAKLRDLVRDTWEIASYSQCTPCKFFDTCDGCPCILRERIHELEIEV